MKDSNLPENLRYLIEEFNRSGLRELHLRKGDFELLLSHADYSGRQPQASSRRNAPAPASASSLPASVPAPQQAAEGPPQGTGLPEGTIAILAPNLGSFYRSPKPGAAPFVEIGDSIAAGDELCLIEVMKLFTTLRSDVAGTVEAVLVADGAMVEAGQPLFAVRAD